MRKKQLIALMALTFMFMITGCKNIGTIDGKTDMPVVEDDNTDSKDYKDGGDCGLNDEGVSSVIYDKGDVSMKTEQESYSSDVEDITITINNTTSNDYYYGGEFSLEQEVEGRWVLVSPKEEIFVITIAYILGGNESNTIVIPLSYYEKLSDGHYRIVKNMVKETNGAEEDNTETVNFLLAAEFNIITDANADEIGLGGAPDTANLTKYTTVNNLNGLNMIIKKDSLTSNGLTLIFQNKSDNTCIYGEQYVLEMKIDGLWYEVPVTIEGNYGFDDIGYEVASNEEKELEVDWKWLYGSLLMGDYRIVKEVSDIRKTRDYNVFYMAAEFSISK